jgi:AraC-like DNA-binding protein
MTASKPAVQPASEHAVKRTRIARHPFGALGHKMKDHVYFLQHGYVFTTPHITCKLKMKFYAAILLAADRKPFTVRIGEQRSAATALVIRAGTHFVFAADDIKFVCLFVEPTHPTFARFQRAPAAGLPLSRDSFGKLDGVLRHAYEGNLNATRANDLFEDAVKLAVGNLPLAPPLDKRIEKSLQLMAGDSPYSLADLARTIGLSYYRLSHLFSQNLGIPLRQFMQWRKVTVTASLLATRSITEVAHEAGFTDSAHLSRTFQEIYGIPPSYLNDTRCVERFYYQER